MKEFKVISSVEPEYSRSVTFQVEGEEYVLDLWVSKHSCDYQLWKEGKKIEVPESWTSEDQEDWDLMSEVEFAGFKWEVEKFLSQQVSA